MFSGLSRCTDGLGRLFWGTAVDAFGFRRPFAACAAVMAAATALLPTLTASRTAFAVAVCAIFSSMFAKVDVKAANQGGGEGMTSLASKIFAFSYLWSVGGSIRASDMDAFDEVTREAFDDAEILFLLTYQVLPATPAARSAAAVAAKATSITFRLGSSLSDFRVGEFKESLGAALDVEDSRFSLVAASPADDSPDNETTIRLKVMPAPPSAQKPSGGGPALSPVAIGQKLVGKSYLLKFYYP